MDLDLTKISFGLVFSSLLETSVVSDIWLPLLNKVLSPTATSKQSDRWLGLTFGVGFQARDAITGWENSNEGQQSPKS